MQFRLSVLMLFAFLTTTAHFTSAQQVTGKEDYPHETVIAGDIVIAGNRKTSESVIRREILFKTGDTIRKQELDELLRVSTENILKTSLFHTATIDSFTNDSIINFRVTVKERWYWWVWPLLENPDRNFNDWLQHNDLTRLSAGLHFQHENVRGRMEKLNLKAMGGYKTYLEGNYEWPYINKAKSLGIGVYALYTSQHEINYATVDNEQVFYHGSRIMYESLSLAANLKYRPGTHFTHFLTLQYWQPDFSDSLPILNPEFFITSDNPRYIGISWLIKADYRDNRYYPLKGVYAESEAGYLADITDTYNQRSFRTSLRGYLPLAKNLYAASEICFRFTGPEVKPYYLQNALGYDREFVRGYEYLVIEAPHYWLFKSHIRYAALPLAIIKVPFIRSEKFNTIPLSIYAGPHFDSGKAFPALDKSTNSLQGQLLAGYGLGIDFVTYYDKVLRCEYTFTNNGTSGFFLHFMAMI